MPSTYSPSLRIELIGAGEQAGTWNTTTNTNLGTLLDTAIAGNVAVSVTSANQALTANNGATDQARQAILTLSTTTVAAFAIYAPPQPKEYIVNNTSAYTATIYNSTVLGNTTAAGTGVAVAAGGKVVVFSDGTNFSTISLPSPGTGTVTSVTGAGTVNGIALTGTVTTSGNLTLGGTLSNVDLTTQVVGTLPIARGGTNSTSTTYCSLTSNVIGTLPVGKGGTGTVTPSLVSGSGVSVTGTWPNQTITATGGGGTVTQVNGVGTVNGLTLTGTVTGIGNLTLGGSLSGSAPSLSVGSATTATTASTATTATTASSATQLSSTNWTVAQSSFSLVMDYSGTPRWSLDPSGNMITVGYSSADSFFTGTLSQLYVGGAKINLVHGGTLSSGAVFQNASGGTSNCMIFTNNVGTALGSIFMDPAINSVTFNNLSDYRLKNSIAPMTGALEKVALLKPCTYKWNNNNADGQGFIAHELQEVVPACVSGQKDALNEDGSIIPQGVDPRYLVATLTAAIQELKALVDAQATRIATLESR